MADNNEPKQYVEIAKAKIAGMNPERVAFSLFGQDEAKDERAELDNKPEVIAAKEAAKKARDAQKDTEKEAAPHIFQKREARKAIGRDVVLTLAGKAPKVAPVRTFAEAQAKYNEVCAAL